jgi:hypothetical protein
MSLAAGTHLGSYEILSLIGAGGMGEVYRARIEQVLRVRSEAANQRRQENRSGQELPPAVMMMIYTPTSDNSLN